MSWDRRDLDTGNLPVRTGLNGFWTAQKHVNADPDFRSGSRLPSDLDLNHGSVLIGSGSNHGSEPDPSITIGQAKPKPSQSRCSRPGLTFLKAGAVESLAKAAKAGPSQAGTAVGMG